MMGYIEAGFWVLVERAHGAANPEPHLSELSTLVPLVIRSISILSTELFSVVTVKSRANILENTLIK